MTTDDYAAPLRYGLLRALIVLGALSLGYMAGAYAASPMRFTRLGLEAGLSEQAVNVITQDPSGFLWIGTEDGLDRYDGYQFTHFTHNRDNPGSLPNNFIADMSFGSSGVQWIATDGGGVVWHDTSDGQFVRLDSLVAAGAADGLERVRVIRTDHEGRVWIGTRDNGLVLFDSRIPALRRFKHKDDTPGSLVDNSVLALLVDRRGYLWIGTEAGVDVLDPTMGTLKHHRLSEQIVPRAGHVRARALLEDSRDTIWIGTEGGLENFIPRTGVSSTFLASGADARALPHGSVEVLYEDREQRLWVGTTDGLARLDREHRSFETYRNDPRNDESLPDNHIVSVFEDRGGLLWVGTKFGGLAKWNPRSWSFGHHLADNTEGFASPNVMSFTDTPDGRLWIGTFGGGLTVLEHGGSYAFTLRAGDGQGGGLGDDHVMALTTDHAGNVWAGTMAGGLDRIAAGTRRVTHFRNEPADPTSLAATGVMSLLEDSKGRIWVGTYGGGLSRLDRDATAFRTYPADPASPKRLSAGRVTALAQDRTGRIWAGTDGGGLNILEPDTGKLTRLRHDFRDAHSLSSDTVSALYIDPQDNVWIGTRGGGLDVAMGGARADEPLHLANLSEANGLPNNTIYGIVPDSAGNLWLSTNHGLARLDPRTRTVSSYFRSHGLQADEFNFGSHYRLRDGRLLFGGTNGFNLFYPNRLQVNQTPPSVALTRILRLGYPLRLEGSYDNLQKLHFGYQDDVITFEFAALDFAAPAANTFEYQLKGFDRGPVRNGSLHSATYTHLPGGQYTLQVRAANADGVWNAAGFGISIDVDPPPWNTWWARVVYASLGVVCIYAVWSRQKRALARAANHRMLLEHKVKERTQQLADRNVALQNANSMLEKVSFCDPLTGLGNRRSLDHAMPNLIADLKAPSSAALGSRLAILLIDLDRLKPINDQYGHEAGDRLLIEVASILKECVRSNDQIVRWGGDEFVIVHSVGDLEGAGALAERIRFEVAKRKFQVGGTVAGRTSCSIGFSLFPFVPGTFPRLGWEKALGIADANLYRAKAIRNAWVGCCGIRSMSDVAEVETLAERDLDAAERSQLVEVRRSARLLDETVELLLRQQPPHSRK